MIHTGGNTTVLREDVLSKDGKGLAQDAAVLETDVTVVDHKVASASDGDDSILGELARVGGAAAAVVQLHWLYSQVKRTRHYVWTLQYGEHMPQCCETLDSDGAVLYKNVAMPRADVNVRSDAVMSDRRAWCPMVMKYSYV
jgi:hypothetical protein